MDNTSSPIPQEYVDKARRLLDISVNRQIERDAPNFAELNHRIIDLTDRIDRLEAGIEASWNQNDRDDRSMFGTGWGSGGR
jgi:hypothetical protein